MDQIGVGVIGVGLMGSLFARLASQLPDSILVGVADIDESRASALGESLNAPAFADYNDLLALPGLDAVVVATPDAFHLQPALAVAQARKHLMIEKPLTTKLEDAIRIVDTCKEMGVTLMVAHVLRFDPSYGEAFKAVKSGKLGEIVHVNLRRTTSISDAERLAGRVTITFYLGSHSVDVIQWIIGSPIVEVTAISASNVMKKFNVDDTVMSLLRFENGAIGTLENSWIRPQGVGSRRLGASLVMMGTEGSFKVDPFQECASLYQYDYVEPILPAYSFGPIAFGGIGGIYRDEFAHFIQCVRTGAAPVVLPEHAISTIKVCGAIEQSIRQGQPVRIDQENVFI